MKKTIATGIVTVALTLGLAGCNTVPKSINQGSTPSEPAVPSMTAASDGTATRPVPYGTKAATDPDSQWDVTITNPNLNATAEIEAEDQSYYEDNPLPPGDVYVSGTMSATVNSRASELGAPIHPQLYVTPVFVGGDSKVYDDLSGQATNFGDQDWGNVPQIITRVGVMSSGLFVFDVPSSALAGGHFAVQNSATGSLVYFG